MGDVRRVRNVVYSDAGREGRGQWGTGTTAAGVERRPGASGIVAAGGFGGMICAAVVAATPDSFEINWN
jgi:hypothetical protein